jgi:hypothetical protein
MRVAIATDEGLALSSASQIAGRIWGASMQITGIAPLRDLPRSPGGLTMDGLALMTGIGFFKRLLGSTYATSSE